MSKLKLLIIMLVFVLFIAGCGTKKQAEDTTPPAPQVAVIDMNKAFKAHPKYNQLLALGQQADTIAAQLEAQQLAANRQIPAQSIPDVSDNQLSELNKASEQEFSAKMSAKQDELNPRLAVKAEAIHGTLADEMKTYTDQVDKEYKPQIFNLQLKLKTVQLTKEQTTALQGELEKIETQRSEALSVKQQQLAGRMDELMAPEKAAIQQQLTAYATELNTEISKKAAAKQTEIVARGNEQQIPLAVTEPTAVDTSPLAMKKQELEALQEAIITDITDKTGKVAIDNGFAAVVANVTVNVSAVDITTQVIAECNK